MLCHHVYPVSRQARSVGKLQQYPFPAQWGSDRRYPSCHSSLCLLSEGGSDGDTYLTILLSTSNTSQQVPGNYRAWRCLAICCQPAGARQSPGLALSGHLLPASRCPAITGPGAVWPSVASQQVPGNYRAWRCLAICCQPAGARQLPGLALSGHLLPASRCSAITGPGAVWPSVASQQVPGNHRAWRCLAICCQPALQFSLFSFFPKEVSQGVTAPLPAVLTSAVTFYPDTDCWRHPLCNSWNSGCTRPLTARDAGMAAQVLCRHNHCCRGVRESEMVSESPESPAQCTRLRQGSTHSDIFSPRHLHPDSN
ncbi:hypothetical protein ACOMHN_016531 [Nucella lapillus]